jgi:hypothetical protein
MSEVDKLKTELLRITGKNYGKSDLQEMLKDAGFICKIHWYKTEKRPHAEITLGTAWTGRSVLINFAKWAYFNWPLQGSFWLTINPGGYSALLECTDVDRTVSVRVNGENGYECRYLEGIADLTVRRLHPTGHILRWTVDETVYPKRRKTDRERIVSRVKLLDK